MQDERRAVISIKLLPQVHLNSRNKLRPSTGCSIDGKPAILRCRKRALQDPPSSETSKKFHKSEEFSDPTEGSEATFHEKLMEDVKRFLADPEEWQAAIPDSRHFIAMKATVQKLRINGQVAELQELEKATYSQHLEAEILPQLRSEVLQLLAMVVSDKPLTKFPRKTQLVNKVILQSSWWRSVSAAAACSEKGAAPGASTPEEPVRSEPTTQEEPAEDEFQMERARVSPTQENRIQDAGVGEECAQGVPVEKEPGRDVLAQEEPAPYVLEECGVAAQKESTQDALAQEEAAPDVPAQKEPVKEMPAQVSTPARSETARSKARRTPPTPHDQEGARADCDRMEGSGEESTRYGVAELARLMGGAQAQFQAALQHAADATKESLAEKEKQLQDVQQRYELKLAEIEQKAEKDRQAALAEKTRECADIEEWYTQRVGEIGSSRERREQAYVQFVAKKDRLRAWAAEFEVFRRDLFDAHSKLTELL